MDTLLTKVSKGIAFGDVSNASVRNILTGISEALYGKFTEQEMYDTLEFFEWKCPYTGKDLKSAIENQSGGYATDHIYPQNQKYCGLNVKGNLVIVDKEANSKKGQSDFETFLRNRRFDDLLGKSMDERENRINKIKEFQQKCNYDPQEIRKKISPLMEERYQKVREEQEQEINKAVKKLGLPVVSKKTNVINKSKVSRMDTEIVFFPKNEEDFKRELISKKEATFKLYYDSGVVKTSMWKVTNFDVKSNLRANIFSRPFWRKRKTEGLKKVEVFIQ